MAETKKKSYYNISKVADTMTRQDGKGAGKKIMKDLNEKGKSEMAVDVFPRTNLKNQDKIYTIASFTIPDNTDITFTNNNITPYDMAVMDAVYTIQMEGATKFTPEDIVRHMRCDFDRCVNPQTVDAVKESVKKLRQIDMTIDCTKESIRRGIIKKNKRCVLQSYLMPVDVIEVTSGNQVEVTGYKLLRKPALHEYAEKMGQIVSVPFELLQTDGLSDTVDILMLKKELIKRIEKMKNKKNNVTENKIIYSRQDHNNRDITTGFLEKLGFNRENYKSYDVWKKRRRQLCDAVNKILDEWTKEGYIKGYEVIKEGKKTAGVEIKL